jgi:beta-galactosidase
VCLCGETSIIFVTSLTLKIESMRKTFALGLLGISLLAGNAQTFKEWQDPEINAINRAPMHTDYFAYESAEAIGNGKTQSQNYMSLDGTWKFFWVANADQRPTDFWKTGYNDKGWDDIQVPGVWELNGYGDPIYVNTGFAWRNQYESNPPYVPTERTM